LFARSLKSNIKSHIAILQNIIFKWNYYNTLSIFTNVMLFLGSMVLMFIVLCWFPNFRIIFDDDGITIKHHINFLSFIIFKKSNKTQWSEIIEVDYLDISHGVGMPFVFGYFQKRSPVFLNINRFWENYRDGMEYAVKKLPQSKFTKKAQKKLLKMGIVFL